MSGRGNDTTLVGHGFDLDDWCSFCGVNPTLGGGLCSMCQADEDFANCEFCHGTSCTQECEDAEGSCSGVSG